MKKIISLLLVFVVFISVLVISYLFINILTQRAYSFPSSKTNSNSSTRGGEYFEGDFPPIADFGPRIGATNVSIDTVIYVYQTRATTVDLQISPKVSWYKIENIKDPPASQNTIFYPAELLQPNTTYNVSGSIMGYSAWWTFITASSIIP